jgi:hypothetical protein
MKIGELESPEKVPLLIPALNIYFPYLHEVGLCYTDPGSLRSGNSLRYRVAYFFRGPKTPNPPFGRVLRTGNTK